jgi:hypothetical protein
MARSKRSKAAKKRYANRNEAIQPSMPLPQPSQLSLAALEAPQPSLPLAEPSQSSLPLEPLQLPIRQESSQSSLPLEPLQLPIRQEPSQLAIEQLREFQENTSYTFTATHSPYLVQPVDTLQANALTLTPNDVDALIQSLPRGNVWKDNLEGFSAFEKFERGATLQNANSVS